MADIPIPGSRNVYNTPEVRRSVLTADYNRLETLENEDKKLSNERQAWTLIKDKLTLLNDKANALTRFDSPLKQMFGNSSNETILTATAEPSATKNEYEVLIEQKADVDKFSSTSLPSSYKPPSGEYIFMVGEKKIKFTFDGGTLSDWMRMANRQGTTFLKAETFRSSVRQEVLILSSLKEGEKNPLLFKGAAEQMANDLGILSKTKVQYLADLEAIVATQNSPYNRLAYSTLEEGVGVMIIQPGSESAITLPRDFELTDQSVLKIRIAVREADAWDAKNNTIRSPTESVTYENITIENEFSELSFMKENNVLANARRIQAISSYAEGQTTPLDPILDLPDVREMTISLSRLKKAEEIILENTTSDKIFVVESMEVTDPRNRDGYLPEKALSFAQDAKLEIDGIEVTRPTNKITDLIPRVGLNLQSTSTEPVTLKIEPDLKGIENTVVDFLFSYNVLLGFMNILSTRDPNVKPDDPNASTPIIDELVWLTEAERKQAYELLGLLTSDYTIRGIKSTLQNIFMSAYDTDDERYRMLSQIGIASSIRGGSGVQRRQYLDIDAEKFQNSLKKNMAAVRRLFASDTTGDNISDTGVAFRVSRYARPYVQYNGLLDARLKSIETATEQKGQDITNYKERIDNKDRKLQTDLRRLESTLNQSEAMTRSMNNYLNPKSSE